MWCLCFYKLKLSVVVVEQFVTNKIFQLLITIEIRISLYDVEMGIYFTSGLVQTVRLSCLQTTNFVLSTTQSNVWCLGERARGRKC